MPNLDSYFPLDLFVEILKFINKIDFSSYFKLIFIVLPPAAAIVYVIFELIRQKFTMMARLLEAKFPNLSPRQIKLMVKRVNLAAFPKDSIIIRQGAAANECFILRSGKAEVSVNYGEPDQTRLGILKEGDLFGEMGLLDRQPRSATITAAEECECVIIDSETFSEFIATSSTDNESDQTLMAIRKVAKTREKTNKAWLRIRD